MNLPEYPYMECAWCGELLNPEHISLGIQEIFSVGGKLNKNIKHKRFQGKFIKKKLVLIQKIIPVFV